MEVVEITNIVWGLPASFLDARAIMYTILAQTTIKRLYITILTCNICDTIPGNPESIVSQSTDYLDLSFIMVFHCMLLMNIILCHKNSMF